MSEAPQVTVVVCAYTLDRWQELILAIDAVEADATAHRTILVIDHNDELFALASERWPGILVLRNRGPRGLSAARNTALTEVETSLVAFLDDDAYPESGWLAELTAAFVDPQVVATGGVARPVWPGGLRSAWLPEELWWVVGCSFRGQPESTERVRNVMGCNMAFRTDPLLNVGGFNSAMGRVGTYPVGGEETEVCILLSALDPRRRISFAPTAVVHHHVTANRLELKYLLSRSYCEGLSKAALSGSSGREQALSTESAYVSRVIPLAVLRELRHPLSGGLAGATGMVCSVVWAGFGYLRGRLSGRREVTTARPALRSMAREVS